VVLPFRAPLTRGVGSGAQGISWWARGKTTHLRRHGHLFGLCVWLTPLFLFLSLSANNNTLPTASQLPFLPSPATAGSLDAVSSPSATSFPTSVQQPRPARSSLFRLMFVFMPGLCRASSRNAEGLIAPPSPGIPQCHPCTPTASPRVPPMAKLSSLPTWGCYRTFR
jgi:hypothetical protein